jgi:hypothetical protein
MGAARHRVFLRAMSFRFIASARGAFREMEQQSMPLNRYKNAHS